MAIEFAYELSIAKARGEIDSNLISISMGDAWISPIDSTLSWAPYLLQLVMKQILKTWSLKQINNFRVLLILMVTRKSVPMLLEPSAPLIKEITFKPPIYGIKRKLF